MGLLQTLAIGRIWSLGKSHPLCEWSLLFHLYTECILSKSGTRMLWAVTTTRKTYYIAFWDTSDTGTTFFSDSGHEFGNCWSSLTVNKLTKKNDSLGLPSPSSKTQNAGCPRQLVLLFLPSFNFTVTLLSPYRGSAAYDV